MLVISLDPRCDFAASSHTRYPFDDGDITEPWKKDPLSSTIPKGGMTCAKSPTFQFVTNPPSTVGSTRDNTGLPAEAHAPKRRKQRLARPKLDNRRYAERLAARVERDGGVFEGGVSCLADGGGAGMRWAEDGWADGPVGRALRCEGWANTSCLPTHSTHWAATTGHRLVRGWFTCGGAGASSLVFDEVRCGLLRGSLIVTAMRSYTRNWGRVKVDVRSVGGELLASRVIDALSELSLSEQSTVVQETAIRWSSKSIEPEPDVRPVGQSCPVGPHGERCRRREKQAGQTTRTVSVVLTPLARETRPSDSYPEPPGSLDRTCGGKFHLRAIECC